MLIIYKTTNKINGKIYIGKHSQDGLEFDGYLGSGLAINNAIKKYGRENFVRETLEVVEDKRIVNEREIFWISELDSTNKKIGYNIQKGGDGFTSESATELNSRPEMRELHHFNTKKMWEDEEYKKKVSKVMRESRLNNPELLEKQSEMMKEAWKDPEYRENFSTKMKEKWNDLEFRNRTSKAISEGQSKEESKAKRSVISKRVWETYREKILESINEASKDPESRKKISEKAKERWKDPEFKKKMSKVMKDTNSEETRRMKGAANLGSKNKRCIYHYVLKSPDSVIYKTDCINDFAKLFDLCRDHLSKICNGRTKQYRGWTLVSKTLRNELDNSFSINN